MATGDDLGRLAMALEGTTSAPHFQPTAFKVARIYATLSPDGLTANLKLTLDEQELKCLTAPGAFQSVPNTWGKQGWTTVKLSALRSMNSAPHYGSPGSTEDQNRSGWNRKQIVEGMALIDKAVRHRRPGPYQVQAAISAIHARAARPEDTDWSEIELLYGTLERMQPSPVISLNRAVAISKARGSEAALAVIEPLATKLGSYFYFHGARGAFLQELGRKEEARVAFDRAIALANTQAEAAHIRMQIDRLVSDH